MNTQHFITNYLHENIIESETLYRMRNVIAEFSSRAPKILVTKCIDGRVHGSKAEGYPATTIRFGRTDGNTVNTDLSNYWFWNRIDNLVNHASCNTKNMPAIFLAYMHRSDKGYGCAAHNHDEVLSYESIHKQAEAVRKVFHNKHLYVCEGITNTDSMAETLLFSPDTKLSSENLIEAFHLKELKDLFQDDFLQRPLPDPATNRYINFKLPTELVKKENSIFHSEFQTSLAMKSFLLLEFSRILSGDSASSQKMVQPDLFHQILTTLNQIPELPKSLVAPFFYQCFWNISYALFQKNRLSSFTEEEQIKHLDHSEELICYGDGFELLPRNKAVLVKTGRGDDSTSLAVAKRVLEANRKKGKANIDKLIHLNIEVSGELKTWEDLNDNISSRIHTMLRHIDEVFGEDVAILTTYSYRDHKRFFPVHTLEDARIQYPIDILEGINSDLQFSEMILKSREAIYSVDFREDIVWNRIL